MIQSRVDQLFKKKMETDPELKGSSIVFRWFRKSFDWQCGCHIEDAEFA